MGETEEIEKEMEEINIEDLHLSLSVARVARKFSDTEMIGSWAIVKSLLESHPEYGNYMGEKLPHQSGPTIIRETRRVLEWLHDVYALFDPNKVKILHGRLVILGLGILDQDLADYLNSYGFIDEIKKELKEPFESLRIEKPSKVISDRTVLLLDTPSKEDRLGRKAFAYALAKRFSRLWKETGESEGHSFIFHLHGPWGAGKTMLLNMIEDALRSDDSSMPSDKRWITVRFNAWRHQHIVPPWWPLMDTIYRQAMNQTKNPYLARKIRYKEWLWRLRTGQRLYSLVALMTSLLALVIIVSWLFSGGPSISTASDTLEIIAAVVALLGAVWSGTITLTHSLISGSASSAQTFLKLSQDPMQKVHVHFPELIKWVDRPVVVLIDDLDRCRTKYVVELLEAIQTLFNDSNVFYVVAADRRWLYVCFETEYKNFSDTIKEPGRRLGSLFLEKVFQLSISVPRMSKDLRKTYMDYLLMGKGIDFVQEREAAQKEFQEATTEEQIFAKLKDSTGNPILDQIRREAAVRQSATREVEVSTEHYLQQFTLLLEPNPRAMKRLVMADGVHRDLAILTDLVSQLISEDRRKQLTLWTIVSLRWPSLAEYLEKYPEKVDLIRKPELGDEELEDIVEDFRPLAHSKAVKDVLNGEGVGIGLDEEAISIFIRETKGEELVDLKASESTSPVMA